MAVRSRPKRAPHFTQEVITSLQVTTTCTWRSALTIITYQGDWLREPLDDTEISAYKNSPRTRFCKLKSVTMGNFFPMSPQCQSPNLRKRLWGEWVRGVAVYLYFQNSGDCLLCAGPHTQPGTCDSEPGLHPPCLHGPYSLGGNFCLNLCWAFYTRDSGGKLVCLSSYAYYTLRAINVYSYFFPIFESRTRSKQ